MNGIVAYFLIPECSVQWVEPKFRSKNNT